MHGSGPDRAASLAVELAGRDRIALGCMGLAGVYGAVDPAVATATVHAALDAGILLFDAAPLYGAGRSELLLGEALPAGRGRVCTKFGLDADAGGALSRDSRPGSVRDSVERSLRRLRRGHVDVLLQHRPDPKVPDDAVAEVLLRLVEEGKALHVGLSSSTLQRSAAMRRSAPLTVAQNELSAGSGLDERESPARFAEQGYVFMAHSPLGRGVLASESVRTFPAGDHRALMDALEPARQRESQLVAQRSGLETGPSRVLAALSWVLSQGANVVAVVGARSPLQVAEVAGADKQGCALEP